ncbi:MAG: glycosyltransferase [Candidatus Omnitrophota bacterium]|nr:glycosyltransferase [Candidatus Omnitrophota bacterium]
MTKSFKLTTIQDYAKVVGDETVDRILKKAKQLENLHVVNVNSTGYGGGVAEILSSMTILMNGLNILTGWRTIIGRPDFFLITKNMHNAIQGGEMDLTEEKKRIYEEVVYENSVRIHLHNHDLVIIHDPQPLPMIEYYVRSRPWIWRCHIDLSNPHPGLWNYLKGFVDKYDVMISSIKEYKQDVAPPQRFCMPAIDPFSVKNLPLDEKVMDAKLAEYKIPTDKPIFCQVSRFDRWKDPQGVIEAFRKAQKEVDATLVLLGNAATDDPEGEEVFESLLHSQNDRIRILPYGDDTILVNALQSRAACVIQKSTKEGFGLTVTEALWKGTPVIGGNVGGIRYQIQDGENGYLVSSVDECAARIVTLAKDKDLRERMGKQAKEGVRKNFLLSRLLEQYLDLFIEVKESVVKG